jgi:hypothetical protein
MTITNNIVLKNINAYDLYNKRRSKIKANPEWILSTLNFLYIHSNSAIRDYHLILFNKINK